MPKSIALQDVQRMFPYEFFTELFANRTTYLPYNPAFLVPNIKNSKKEDKEKLKQLFDESRQNSTYQALVNDNILEIEPLGEMLMLDLCIREKDLEAMKDKTVRSQKPLSILLVQLYDSEQLPVFASDVTEETIQSIPEVLWDDPNLLIAVATTEEDGAKVAVLKIPPEIEKNLFIQK